MRKRTVQSLLMFLLLLSVQGMAQNKLTVENVYKVTLRNSGTILENDRIKGYYFFYVSDKVDKRTNEYTLQIIDENLNKVKDIKFQDEKNIQLLESTYNGASIGFLFWNDKENTIDFRLYNLDGKQSFTYSKELDKKSEKYFEYQLENNGKGDEAENQMIYDIAGKGFVSVTPLREDKKYTYDVNYYASGKRKNWTYNPAEEGKMTTAQFLGANDEIAVIEVMSKARLMSKDIETTLLGLNLETGKKVFEIPTTDGKNRLVPMNIAPLKGTNQFMMVGPYYEGTDNVQNEKSTGLGIWLVDNTGKIVKSKYMSWIKDLGKYLDVDQKGKVSDMGYVYVHRIMQTDNGRIFVIGEGYKKVADGVGIAMNVLNGGYTAAVTKLQITNMLLLELSKDFDLTNAQVYDKNRNSFSLNGYGNTDFVSPHTLALMAKAAGAFDYSYTQMGEDHSSFVSAYTDYEKSKEYKGLTFHAISYYDGKLTTDKINLSSKATRMALLPAKIGSVVIMEYFRKDKRLEIRMEKVN
jgi:hypothetical protein